MISKRACVAAAAFAGAIALPAAASTIDLYAVGSTHPGGALDPVGNALPGVPIVSWTEMLWAPPASVMLLSILAEGIDGGALAPNGGEHDGVYVNGMFAGYLTQQSFYTPGFSLKPGAGALAGVTAETLSLFDVTSLLVAGMNAFEIRVDTANWVNEIEVVSLAPLQSTVPEPASLPLAGIALAAVAIMRRRPVRR